jgi:hypothetical protein
MVVLRCGQGRDLAGNFPEHSLKAANSNADISLPIFNSKLTKCESIRGVLSKRSTELIKIGAAGRSIFVMLDLRMPFWTGGTFDGFDQ